MKKNILNKSVFILTLFLVFGCKTRKPSAPLVIDSKKAETKTVSKAEVLSRVSGKQINYSTAVIKAKADLEINSNKNDVSMNIRMQKGKTIWISVTAIAGLEVARALITPDSIKILNKLESSYIKKPFSYIYQFANKQVNFATVQDLFIGNAMAGTLSQSSSIDVNAGQSHIKGDLSGLAYLLIFNANSNLIQSNLNDKATAQTLSVNYGEHRNVSNQEIPHVISIKSNASNKRIGIDLNYNYVGINESVEFPFNVSKRFTVKD